MKELKNLYLIKVTEEEVELLISHKCDIEKFMPNGDKIIIEMSSK